MIRSYKNYRKYEIASLHWRLPQRHQCNMTGDQGWCSLSNSVIKNQQFPFLLIRTEIEPAEENLELRTEISKSKPILTNAKELSWRWKSLIRSAIEQENKIWIIRTLLFFCVATSQKWFLARLSESGTSVTSLGLAQLPVIVSRPQAGSE